MIPVVLKNNAIFYLRCFKNAATENKMIKKNVE